MNTFFQLLGALIRLGQYLALLKAIVNLFNGQAVALLQIPLGALLLWLTRQFAKAEFLPPEWVPTVFSGEWNRTMFALLEPFATLGLLLWVFHSN